MRTLFFCARNFKDYLNLRGEEIAALANVEISARDILNSPQSQDILSAHMQVYGDSAAYCDAPIVGRTGIRGLHLDFNFGLRLEVPEGNFRVVIGDYDSAEIFLDEELSDVRLISVEKYFIRWQVEVLCDGVKIFSHVLDLNGRRVTIAAKLDGLGDVLAILPFVREFKRQHKCEVSLLVHDYLKEFAAHLYPDVPQVDALNFDNYANYFPIMCVSDYPKTPVDLRNCPIERVAGEILGLATLPEKPTFKPTLPPVTKGPYVCISVQASSNRKGWLYPGGWDIVVAYLKELGYRVFCIDKNAEETNCDITITKPAGAEDFTGDVSIMERANMLYHAEFFIGLGSGLAWIANIVNCPVVLIAGFSQDWAEFYTPYRVANRLACNGCFNDLRVRFIGKYLCPLHGGTPRELECQKKIYPQTVIGAIQRLILDRNLIPPIAALT